MPNYVYGRVILDEPTAALDPDTEARLLPRLRAHRAGRSTLVITHRAPTARAADTIAVLDGGRTGGGAAPLSPSRQSHSATNYCRTRHMWGLSG